MERPAPLSLCGVQHKRTTDWFTACLATLSHPTTFRVANKRIKITAHCHCRDMLGCYRRLATNASESWHKHFTWRYDFDNSAGIFIWGHWGMILSSSAMWRRTLQMRRVTPRCFLICGECQLSAANRPCSSSLIILRSRRAKTLHVFGAQMWWQ